MEIFLNIVAQIFGVAGAVFLISSYQTNSHKKILQLQTFATAYFTIHFFMIGAYAGSLINFVGIFRAIVFSQNDKKWAKNPIWIFVFSAAFVAVNIITWEGAISLFMCIGMTLATIGLSLENNTAKRILLWPSSPVWIVYNISKGSVPCTITEILTITSITIAIIRFDILKQKEKSTLPVDKKTSQATK